MYVNGPKILVDADISPGSVPTEKEFMRLSSFALSDVRTPKQACLSSFVGSSMPLSLLISSIIASCGFVSVKGG